MHQIGHVLSAQFNVTHGVTLAIMMPAFFRYTASLNDERAGRYAIFGERIYGLKRDGRRDIDVANEFIDKFEQFIISVGVPTKLSEVGITEKDFDMIADEVVRLGCDADGNLPSIPKVGRDGIIKTLQLAK